MRKLILSAFAMIFTLSASAGVTGLWQTIDDETGKPKSVVSIYEEGGVYFGKILFTYNEQGRPNIIKTVTGFDCDVSVKAEAMPDTPAYCNLVIIKDLKPGKNGKYTGGTITDPKKNKTYNAEMWLDGDKLIVRGKIVFLGRNQTWRPFSEQDLSLVGQ